jgi:hypothetical protein
MLGMPFNPKSESDTFLCYENLKSYLVIIYIADMQLVCKLASQTEECRK